MRFKAFQNLPIGKLKGKNKKVVQGDEDSPIPEIAEIEDELEGKTGDVEKAGKKLPEFSKQAGIIPEPDDIPIRPHGPAAELTIEPEDLQDDAGITLDELDSDDSLKLGEEVKISEVSAEKAAAAPQGAPTAAAAATEEVKPEEQQETEPDENDSLNSLFSDEEEEENPLDALINSLPDVSVQELMDDLEEIQRIIKEWRPSSKGIR
jgi:ribosomal protein L12E/L44/L45/RPP1/RPP2